mgnify:CR=1 FL=1|jgi:hypothetical protein
MIFFTKRMNDKSFLKNWCFTIINKKYYKSNGGILLYSNHNIIGEWHVSN